MTDTKRPKLFVSYSWSTHDHEAWVVSLAEELVSQGIDVILDKWHLQPGHDANAFMESIVTDPGVTKVVLVCDEKYVEKCNKRSGGAGTEAQIISPELYSKRSQDKFVAVVREYDKNGKAYLPVYYGGRIYIDLSSSDTYGSEFDRLVRWAWDRPLYVRPEVGPQPSFLSADQPAKIASSVAFRRAFEAIRSDSGNAPAVVSEYLGIVAQGLEAFRIRCDNREDFDEHVVKSIEDFAPTRKELVELFSTIARYRCDDEMCHNIHGFFERLISYMYRPSSENSWNELDFDNFRFIIHETFLFMMSTLIQHERFSDAAHFLDNEYYFDSPNGAEEKMHSYRMLCAHVRTFDLRNQRLNLRRLSVHADMLNEHAKSVGIEFSYVMAADFVLYLRDLKADSWSKWWPHTLLYAGRFGGAFEMFARAKSSRYFEKIRDLIGYRDKQELGARIAELDPGNVPRWEFNRVDPRRLCGFEALATTP